MFPRCPLPRIAGALLGCVALLAAAEPSPPNPRLTGTPLLQVWQTEDFGASPVNWRVVQHPANGFIYVGNNFGLLEFDGASWRLIPMPQEGAVRALAVDPDGRVWAAGNGEIAVLDSDAAGVSRLVDQTPRLPTGDRIFGVINRAVATTEGVYLSGDRRIFLFRPDGGVRVWRTEGSFSPIWSLDRAVYVARDFRDLLLLKSDGGTETIASFSEPDQPLARTYAAARQPGGDAIVLTRNGPMRWTGRGPEATPLPATTPLTRDFLRTPQFLADGRMIAGHGGAVEIFGHDGALEQRFDTSHGLPSETINGFAEDREGGLWIALQNGLARLQLDSPFALHGVPQGLGSGPRRLTRWHDRLYVAHGGGVAWRDATTGRFNSVEGLRIGSNRPVVIDGRLLVSTQSGIREIDGTGNPVAWTRTTSIALLASKRAPGWLFNGDSDGLTLLAPTTGRASGWRVVGRLRNLPVNVVQIYDSDDGFVWVVGSQGDLWRIDFRRGLEVDAPCELFDAERGVPAARRRDHVQVFSLGPEVIAAGRKWLLRFDPARGRFEPAAAELGGVTSADAFDVVDANTAWLHVDEPDSRVLRVSRATSAPGASWKVEPFPASELNGLILNSIFLDEGARTLWIAGQGALVSMDLDWKPQRAPAPLEVRVRRVATRDGTVLYGGATALAHLALAAHQDAMRLEFAAATFPADYQGRRRVEYRTRIAGLDTGWSPWTTESYRDVTNLPYRQLDFEVQARTANGRLSRPEHLALFLAPPWWLSRWMFAAYLALAAGGVAGFVRVRTRALRRRAEQLEQVVLTRTAELAEKNQTLAHQNTELTHLRQLETQEKIAARLGEEKARLEVLRYQLNPHFLFNALTSVCAQLPPAPGGARSTIERLTDFCQLTLFRPEGDGNPTLGDELKMLTAYLDIERTRWGELLAVEIACPPELRAVQVPTLLLLPLVENALKYGRATNAGAMTLRMSAARDGDALVLTVANTGTWVEAAGRGSVPSLGIGLENLRQRLQRYYPGAHEFVLAAKDGWVTATVRLNSRGP